MRVLHFYWLGARPPRGFQKRLLLVGPQLRVSGMWGEPCPTPVRQMSGAVRYVSKSSAATWLAFSMSRRAA